MKFKEIINKSEAELRKELTELQSEVAQLAVKVKLGQVKNISELGQKRKTIAQLLTALRQK